MNVTLKLLYDHSSTKPVHIKSWNPTPRKRICKHTRRRSEVEKLLPLWFAWFACLCTFVDLPWLLWIIPFKNRVKTPQSQSFQLQATADPQADLCANLLDKAPSVRIAVLPLLMASTGGSEVHHTASMAAASLLPTTTSSSETQGTRSNNTVPLLPQLKLPIYKPSPRVRDGRPPYTTQHEITFLHSEYPFPSNLLLQLSAFDAVESGQTGLYAHTAWLACAIMACNAWNGYLVKKDEENCRQISDNLDIILLERKYSFHVSVSLSTSVTQTPYLYSICSFYKK